ncbi:hypothetical protein HPP92_014769 [Vanilla planifolia]|uniref:Uncharacterized protein n=1 Tax=Vanilla planifolia TaxID=51239 RepID=A0A835UT13_VANPL|nr:hypothetical protein HPP92_014769 [Vanilla planifolia]
MKFIDQEMNAVLAVHLFHKVRTLGGIILVGYSLAFKVVEENYVKDSRGVKAIKISFLETSVEGNYPTSSQEELLL